MRLDPGDRPRPIISSPPMEAGAIQNTTRTHFLPIHEMRFCQTTSEENQHERHTRTPATRPESLARQYYAHTATQRHPGALRQAVVNHRTDLESNHLRTSH